MPDKDGEKQKWYVLDGRSISNLVVVLIGILFYVGLSHVSMIESSISKFMKVLSPFIVGFAIAYLLNTPMSFFERSIYNKLRYRRVLSILTVYALAVAVLSILLTMILPQVAQSIMDLYNNMNSYMGSLTKFVQDVTYKLNIEGDEIISIVGTYQELMGKLGTMINEALPKILDFGVAVGSGVITAITALISSIYMLAGKGRLVPQIKRLIYALIPRRRADKFLEVCHHANRVFSGFIMGKLLDSAIIGVLCFILCLIIRIPYPMLVAVIVGVTNIIPFFGPFIGAIPCMMILVIVDPWAALRFLILVVALQQFDGNILGPKILGDSTGLSAIWVLVAIVVGGGLFSFAGMILGVPTFAVIYELVRAWVNKRLAAKGIDSAALERHDKR